MQLAGKLKITWRGNGYEVMDAASGRVLQAKSPKSVLLGTVGFAKRAKSEIQRWAIVKNPEGGWSLFSASGAALTAMGKSCGKALRLALPNAPREAQRFKLKEVDPVSPGTYQLLPRASSSTKCLYASSAAKKTSAALSVRKAKDAFDERFCIQKSGAVLTCNPDMVVFGASTIKGLYTTYLFESYIAKGRLSWSQISSLAYPAVVNSDNDAYRSLRAMYGSESGFASWLGSVGVGYYSTWGDYSPRTLAKAWTHMQDYSTSGKKGVGTWKSLFSHSHWSAIHEALGGKKKTYTKPGWMRTASWCGPILNDAGIVDAGKGDRYILAIESTLDGFGSHAPVQRVVKALDRIQAKLPKSRP